MALSRFVLCLLTATAGGSHPLWAHADTEAQPDPVSGAVEGWLERPFTGGDSAPASWNLSARASSAAVGGEQAGAAMALSLAGDAALAYEYGHYSSRVATGADLRLGREPGLSPWGLSHWAELRPWELGAFTFDLDHDLAVHARPTLSRRPDLPRSAYSREQLGVLVRGLHWRGHHWGFELVRVAETFEFTWQRGEGADGRRFGTSSNWALFALTRDPGQGPEARVELLALEADAIDATSSAAVMTTLFGRAKDVPLGPLPVRVSGAFGYAGTGYTTLSANGSSYTIETEDLPLLSGVPVGRVRIDADVGSLCMNAGARRSMFLTYDVHLGLEERVHAGLALPTAIGDLSVNGFAASTRLWTDATTSHRERTGGAELRYSRGVGRGWTLDAAGELARSFYPSLDGALTPSVGNAYRFELGVSKSLGRARDLLL